LLNVYQDPSLTSSSKQQIEKPSAPKPPGYPHQGAKQEGIIVPGAPEVVLPPDSFLVLRLPFVYHTVEKNGIRRPLSYQKDTPECSAWLVGGTTLRLLAKGSGAAEAISWQ
jgi:hypothetical protein